MGYTLSIVAFALGILLVIMLHEAGHFLVAKKFGFKIEEYFVGFGPKLWSFRRGEIEYGVKALPLGGYVKIAGMNPYEEVVPEDLPRAYGSKPRWQRALVILAGPGIHFVIGAVLFSVWFALAGDPRTGIVGVTQVAARINGHTSPAAAADLEPGDRIIQIGTLERPNDDELAAYMKLHIGEPVTFKISREGRVLDLQITPELAKVGEETIPRIGIEIELVDIQKPGPVGALVSGVSYVGTAATESVYQMGQVFGPHGIGRVWHLLSSDAPRQPTDPASFIGIGQQVGALGASGGAVDIIWVLAFVTVFIGLLNLVPLPPLDGSHLLILLIEKVRGRAVDMRRVIPISVAVMAFLLIFVGSNIFLDFTKPLPGP